MEPNGVLNATYDETNGQLRTNPVGSASASVGTKQLEAHLIWSLVYDAATNSIRTVS